MPDFQSIQWFTGLAAGVCILCLPFWMMGLPGVDGQYAKGWKIGLNTLFLYPVAWLINRLIHWRAGDVVNETELMQLQSTAGTVYIVLFLVAILAMIFAFKTMRKAD